MKSGRLPGSVFPIERRGTPILLGRFNTILHYIGVEGLILLIAALIPAPLPGATTVIGLPVLCPFHRWTGLPCPDCGLTRSLICCAHGLFSRAFAFHPLGPATFLILVALVCIRIGSKRQWHITPRLLAGGSYLGAALFLLIWIARLTHVLPSPP
jgi:hypothetical protein